MDRPDVFMPLYIGDYLAGTSRLTTELHGAYMLLIMDYWMNGALPDDNNALASIARMNLDAWSIARAVLEKYFSIADGVWIHKRIEEELQKAVEKKSKAKEKAEKAAKARWGNAPSIPQAMLKECPSPSPSPSDKELKDIVPSEREAVPVQEIVNLFNKSFETLPEVKILSEKRRATVRKRWLENKNMQSIERWQDFFAYIKKSEFLMGRSDKPFSLTFDWMFNPTNFIKIYEGNYHK